MSSCFAVLSSDLLVGGGECALLFSSLTPGEGRVLMWLTHRCIYSVSQNHRGCLSAWSGKTGGDGISVFPERKAEQSSSRHR